jgi:hypothetical protein
MHSSECQYTRRVETIERTLLITIGGRPVTVMAFTVTNGSITTIHALAAPTRLGQVVPSWVA